jgi:hypothetical protein
MMTINDEDYDELLKNKITAENLDWQILSLYNKSVMLDDASTLLLKEVKGKLHNERTV